MDNPRMLSGYELVSKGITKIDATLPEIGLKDVLPNGSWLEQKQIQSALEARKHLVEVERIEKCGALSYAEWREDLSLAEVMRQTGGYWQYFGFSIGKKLYLKPEEALFLMEVNCLNLKFNEVTVSLQQAYALLLRNKLSIIQYKVYASLSRLGYKVFRHKEPKTIDEEKGEIKIIHQVNDAKVETTNNNSKLITVIEEPNTSNFECPNSKVIHKSNNLVEEPNILEINALNEDISHQNTGDANMECDDDCNLECITEENNKNEDLVQSSILNSQDTHDAVATIITNSSGCDQELQSSETENIEREQNIFSNERTLLQRIINRRLVPCNTQNLHNLFDSLLPNLYEKHNITLTGPDDEYLPKNIFLNKISYNLNLDNIKAKCRNESTSYEESDDSNDLNLGSVWGSSSNANNVGNIENMFSSNMRFPRHFPRIRPFNWRPYTNMNFFRFNLFLQRPFLPNAFMTPRLNFQHRHPFFSSNFNQTNHNQNNGNSDRPNMSRKRGRYSAQSYHLQAIKNLASRLKVLVGGGNMQIQNIQALQRVIATYNSRYRIRLRLTEQFDIIEDSTIVDTIELEDDDDSINKKPRRNNDDNDEIFHKNLSKLKQLALRLKNLECEKKVGARHRRAFSNAIKTFNKSFHADIYINDKFEIINRRHITLDCSSDSDCVIEEMETVITKGKQLRNPLNILKQLSEQRKVCQNQTKENGCVQNENSNKSSKLLEIFNKHWLPDDNDFGRAEIPLNSSNTHLMEGFIYDFIKENPNKYHNWLEVKSDFLRFVEESTREYEIEQNETLRNNSSDNSSVVLSPLVKPHDCTDMPSILNKLRIIQTSKNFNSTCDLSIDYDVFNRDVQNFRKTNPPKPHFRIICVSESSSLPSGIEVATLHAKYNDQVPIVLAVAGISSVSYLQMSPSDLPVYISSNILS